MLKRRWIVRVSMAVALLWAALPCRADAPTREYLIKAAFIYNFTQFIHWPEEAFPSKDSPLIIATLGSDPFNGALETAMSGKSAEGHSLEVRHYPSLDQLGGCQLLFVPASEDSSLANLFAKLGHSPVLTVGEDDAFSAAGGDIRLFLEENKMRFEIDPQAVSDAGIQVSAKLMQLARIYKK